MSRHVIAQHSTCDDNIAQLKLNSKLAHKKINEKDPAEVAAHKTDVGQEIEALIAELTASGNSHADKELALVVDGATLAFTFSEGLKLKFLSLARQCKVHDGGCYNNTTAHMHASQAVVACRTTPLQKALVVELVKVHEKVMP